MGQRAVSGAHRPRRGGSARRGDHLGPVHRRAGHGHHHRAGCHRRRTRYRHPPRPLAGPGRCHTRRSVGVVPQRGDRRPPESSPHVLPGPGPAASDDPGHLRQAAAVRPGTAPTARSSGRGGHRCVSSCRAIHRVRRVPAGHAVVVPIQVSVARSAHRVRFLRRLCPLAPVPRPVRAAHLWPSGDAAGDHPAGPRRLDRHQQCAADSLGPTHFGRALPRHGHHRPRRVGAGRRQRAGCRRKQDSRLSGGGPLAGGV